MKKRETPSKTCILGSNSWIQIKGRGEAPGCLQGHTMVEYQDIIYVFGGELSFCNDQETPLWMFDTKVDFISL